MLVSGRVFRFFLVVGWLNHCQLMARQLSHPEDSILFHTPYLSWGLNSRSFPMVGMVINLRFPIKGGMTIPNIGS